MELLVNSYRQTGDLHHAYAFEGDSNLIIEKLEKFFSSELNLPIRANPDYRVFSYETFGIDEARGLIELQMRKSFSGGKKVFVINFRTITTEAQNALLKIFEEPTSDTHFFLIVNSFERLLPTLRSRIFFVSRIEGETAEPKRIAGEFIKSNIKERMEIVSEIAEDKDKTSATQLLNGLEIILSEERKGTSGINTVLEEIIKSKSYLEDRSPSIKLLLEHIAVNIPVGS